MSHELYTHVLYWIIQRADDPLHTIRVGPSAGNYCFAGIDALADTEGGVRCFWISELPNVAKRRSRSTSSYWHVWIVSYKKGGG